ncbi:hypothetical protein CTI12_AA000860 [Artemisia annua]|uniref:Uncharacterized protein n=1 Tax=Artemisia annua TaxID=35608 RepID=A0A2U1QMW2_ARTAN|nr:hypothetical protein CTI12_AA000860 [Artemisia annua]
MQSRLVQVSKLNKILFADTQKYQTLVRGSSRFASQLSGENEMEGDDAMTQGVDTQGETGNPKPDDDEKIVSTKKDDHYVHPKTGPSNLSSSKLENPGVNTPLEPHMQQKRTKSTKLDLTCAGLDGSPWPEDDEKDKATDRKEQEDDDIEYFKHHKASPLSELEIGDTRKPLEKVAQATAGGYFGDEKVITWKPEQLDTAEQSLMRAAQMFREAAARGVPEWPHSRRLRELRGEDW